MPQSPNYTGEEQAWNLRLIGHTDLNGYGDGMQIMVSGTTMYVGHVDGRMGTSIVDVSDPTSPSVIKQIKNPANTHSHKVQTAGNLLMVNYEAFPSGQPVTPEKAGMQIYDIADRANPKEIGFFDTGGRGIHRIWYAGGDYAYFSVTPEGYSGRILMIADVSDPARPEEVSRWWMPGQWEAGGETPDWPEALRPRAHHAIVSGDRAYLGYWDAGFFILDISDVTAPKEIAHLSWTPEDGANTHTALPLPARNLLITTDEETVPDCKAVTKRTRVIDIEKETSPRVISKIPIPEGDFCTRGLRFGPHNLHENRPESFQSDQTVFLTYFNAGLRVIDLSKPEEPTEIATYIPRCPEGQKAVQTNGVFVAENGLIYISDRISGGVDILELTL